MFDNNPLSTNRPTTTQVVTGVALVLLVAGVLVLATGGSVSTLLVGAIAGAALGTTAGWVVLSMLRVDPRRPDDVARPSVKDQAATSARTR